MKIQIGLYDIISSTHVLSYFSLNPNPLNKRIAQEALKMIVTHDD